MNSEFGEDRQRIVNNDVTELSVTLMDDLSDIVASQPSKRPAALVEDVLAEIDAIPTTADYAVGIPTPHDAREAVLPEDRQAMLDAALADFDLDDLPVSPRSHQELAKLYRDTHADDIEHNKRYGHTRQWIEKNAQWRTTPEGKEHRKLTRKEKRHLKAAEEGRTVKSRRRFATDEERQAAKQESGVARQAKHRAGIATTDQSADRQTRRINAKKREQAEAEKVLADKAIF